MNNLILALTGIGSSGIGEFTVEHICSTRNAKIYVCDRDKERAMPTVTQLQARGHKIDFSQADMSNPEDVSLFFERIEIQEGRLDACICNVGWAGETGVDNIERLSLEHYLNLMAVNSGSALMCSQESLKFFRKQKHGSIVFLGSLNSEISSLGQLGYSMAKSTLRPLMQHLLVREGDYLRVNIVRPGPVITNSKNWQKRLAENPNREREEARILNRTKRLTRPEEVAELVAWIALDAPFHVNGTEISIDGGLQAAGFNLGSEGRESLVHVGQLLEQNIEKEVA